MIKFPMIRFYEIPPVIELDLSPPKKKKKIKVQRRKK